MTSWSEVVRAAGYTTEDDGILRSNLSIHLQGIAQFVMDSLSWSIRGSQLGQSWSLYSTMLDFFLSK